MKKACIFLSAGVLMLAMSASALAVALTADVWPDMENGTVRITGMASSAFRDYISVTIAPSSLIEITTEVINEQKIMMAFARAAADGAIDMTVDLPNAFDSGEYAVRIACRGVAISKKFIFVNYGRAMTALREINNCSADDMENILAQSLSDFGLNEDEYSKFSGYISEGVYALRPSGGYSLTAFLDEYMARIALSYVKSGEKTVGDALQEYSAYLHVDYKESYANYSEAVSGEAEALIKAAAGYSEGSFAGYYNRMLLLARLRKPQSVTDLSELVLKEAEQMGVNLSAYGGIDNEYYQNKVFQSLYNMRASFTSLEDFKAKFGNEVEIQGRAAGAYDKKVSGGSGGGRISAAAFGGEAQAAAGTFETNKVGLALKDISAHWAETDIRNLYQRGFISGYEDGTFRPEGDVTRGEFAAMMTRVLALPETDRNFFEDVGVQDWFEKDVNRAANAEIIKGYDKKFYPYANITRQDMAVMIYNGLVYKKVALQSGGSSGFGDSGDMSDYAKTMIFALQKDGMVSGVGGDFLPQSHATRAQAAVFVSRILSKVEGK